MNSRTPRWAAAVLLAVTVQGAQALNFAVNEGVTYRVADDEIRQKYAVIAADLSRLLKQPVSIVPTSQYSVLRRGLAEKSYDIAMVHPAHISIEAMKKSGYRLAAVTKGFQEYRASFLVKADSPLHSLSDLKDRSLGAPDQDSITSWITRASIRDALGDAAQVKYVYTRYQDAVPFFVENSLTQSGATASSAVIRQWQAQGGKVLFVSRPVPIKHLIVGPQVSAEDFARLRDYFIELDSTEEGRKKLLGIQWKGFAAYDEAELIRIGTWLGL